MDSLSCNDTLQCRTCEHFVRGGCALEASIDLALAEPRRPSAVELQWTRQRALA